MSTATFLHLDGSPVYDTILGFGNTGIVVRRDGHAVKLPLKWAFETDDTDDTSTPEQNLQIIKHEADVYQRLQDCPGVVKCYGFCEKAGLRMELMETGDLSTYLLGTRAEQQRPPRSTQLSWILQMTRSLAHIHDRCVIVVDIAERNFLLSGDMSTIVMCDFTEAILLAPDTNMELADINGYTIYTDIGQLGAVIYNIVTGRRCRFDLFKDQSPGPACAAWPRCETLPFTEGVWLGEIIEKCWTEGAFRNTKGLVAALELADGEDCSLESEKDKKN